MTNWFLDLGFLWGGGGWGTLPGGLRCISVSLDHWLLCNIAGKLHYPLDLFRGADVDFTVCFQDHHQSQQNQSGLHGIYLRAFCTGLDSVLQPYRQALLDLEQEVKERDVEQETVLLLTDCGKLS